MKRILCIIIVLCILVSAFCFEASSLEYYNCNNLKGCEEIKLIEDSNQIYLCGYQGTQFFINRIYPTNDNITLTCEKRIDDYVLSNGILSILCKDNNNNCQYIYFYDIQNDIFTHIIISALSLIDKTSFTVCGNSVFLIDADNNHFINEYSKRGNFKNKYYFQNEVTRVITGKDDNIFAISQSSIYKKYSDNFECVLTSVPSPIDFVDSNIMIDYLGNIYDSFNYLCSSNNESSYPSGGKINDIVYTPSGGKICGYSLTDGKLKCTYDLNAKQLRTYGDKVFALCGYSVYIIPKSNFKYEETNSQDHINSDDKNSFSTEYTIDNDKMQIRDIPPSSTFSTFKKNFTLNGYTISVYKTNGEKIGGSDNVGTAMTAILESDSETLEYELSIKGDITGEGNCNTRDRDTLADYILGTVTFNGVYTYSADMNNDGKIDTIDLILILRYIKSKKP